MDLENQTLIRIGTVIVLLFIVWMIIMIIRRLRGDVTNKEDIYEYFRR